jgi:hypothetical protein
MVMDQAGWHIAAGLEVPANMRFALSERLLSPGIGSTKNAKFDRL